MLKYSQKVAAFDLNYNFLIISCAQIKFGKCTFNTPPKYYNINFYR